MTISGWCDPIAHNEFRKGRAKSIIILKRGARPYIRVSFSSNFYHTKDLGPSYFISRRK